MLHGHIGHLIYCHNINENEIHSPNTDNSMQLMQVNLERGPHKGNLDFLLQGISSKVS